MDEYRKHILNDINKEWFTFIATFSRFEFAMKRAKLLKSLKDGQKAEVGWDKFADKLGYNFLTACQANAALEEMFASPPKLLFVVENDNVPSEKITLAWLDGVTPTTARELLQSVRTVRNSLFHGEKNVSRDRDVHLLSMAQIILDTAWATASANKEDAELVQFCQKFYFNA